MNRAALLRVLGVAYCAAIAVAAVALMLHIDIVVYVALAVEVIAGTWYFVAWFRQPQSGQRLTGARHILSVCNVLVATSIGPNASLLFGSRAIL